MLQITFRHMDACDSLRHVAEEKLERVRAHHEGAAHGHLVVDQEHHASSRKHVAFTVHLELTVGRAHTRVEARASHEIAACAVREVFESAEKQLASQHHRRSA